MGTLLPPPTIEDVGIHVGAETTPPLPLPPDGPLALAARLIGRRVRIVLKDGRTLSGTLTCVDPQANLVLGETVTLGGGGDNDDSAGDHAIGTVIVPAAQRVSTAVEVEAGEEDAWRRAVDESV